MIVNYNNKYKKYKKKYLNLKGAGGIGPEDVDLTIVDGSLVDGSLVDGSLVDGSLVDVDIKEPCDFNSLSCYIIDIIGNFTEISVKLSTLLGYALPPPLLKFF
jgi:hypothetical protein